MKRNLLLVFFCTISTFLIAQNGTVKVKLKEKDSEQAITNQSIWFNTIKTITNENGEVTISLPYGTYILVISGDEYETYSLKFELNSEEVELNTIFLTPKNYTTDLSTIDEHTLSSDDIEDKYGQNISGLLQAFSDPFTNIASFKLF